MAPPNEVLNVKFPHGQEFPVSPTPHMFYSTTDKKIYNRMMVSILKYQEARAEAERVMFTELLECIPKGHRGSGAKIAHR